MSLANYAEARARIYDQLQFALEPERLEFWRIGLNFLDVSAIPNGQAVQCPFCEEFTITRDKASILRERLDRTDQYTQTRNHLQEFIENCREHLKKLIEIARSLLPNQLDDTARNRLTTLIPSNVEEIQTFSDKHSLNSQCFQHFGGKNSIS
jgi:hypothetical protein